MNSDHRSDLMLYDKENGRWYIAYTDVDLVNSGQGAKTITWDKILQYDWKDKLEIDPWMSKYSRPAVSDLASPDVKYFRDGWADISIICSDGYWRADLGGPNGPDGKWDIVAKYLTDDQLSAAPGWAYQAYVTSTAKYNEIKSDVDRSNPEIFYLKTPDTLPEAGRLQTWKLGIAHVEAKLTDDFADCLLTGRCTPAPPTFTAGNESTLVPSSGRWYEGSYLGLLTLGDELTFQTYWASASPKPLDGFTSFYIDPSCKPLAMDNMWMFQCKDEWQIIERNKCIRWHKEDKKSCEKWDKQCLPFYVTTCDEEIPFAVRRIPMAYDTEEFVLPGRPYVGGISYADTQKIIQNSLLENPNVPPPIIVDMPMVE